MSDGPASAAVPNDWVVEPFLHVAPDVVYNPLTGRRLLKGSDLFAAMAALRSGVPASDLPDAQLEVLSRDGWLVEQEPEQEVGTKFRLRFVSLESHTVCNQACYFCPVSVAPRDQYFMPMPLFESILEQLADYRDTIEGISTINYNEPSIDKRLVDQIAAIKRNRLPAAIVTNGSGLTAKKVDQIVELGGVSYLSVNYSTMDREHYQQTRKADQAQIVRDHLLYMKDLPLAETMEIAVLGRGDDQHAADFQAIGELFSGSRFDVKFYEVMDRAGYLESGRSVMEPIRRLGGCDQSGSRPLEWLHVNPYGQCILCCQDYDENNVVGDLTQMTLDQVLTGPDFARMRRWAYGIEEAPDDFICRRCTYALCRND